MPFTCGPISTRASTVGEEWAKGNVEATVEGSGHTGHCGSEEGHWPLLGGSRVSGSFEHREDVSLWLPRGAFCKERTEQGDA